MKLRLILRCVIIVLVAVIGYSGFKLQDIRQEYTREAEMHSRLLQYRPQPTMHVTSASLTPSTEFAELPEQPTQLVVNQSLIDLQAVYPDIVGWLTIPNTQIDYPFVQSHDNDFYLRRDLDQNVAQAGTIFMDYRNNSDFSDFNTIIFGHNMRNGSMFGTIKNFNDQTFFDTNRTGTIFLANEIYEIEIMAFAVIKPDDRIIYNPNIATKEDKLIFLEYVKGTARYYKDISVTATDRIVTFSTCSYEFNDARMVIIGKLVN